MKKQIALILFLFIAICINAQTINVKGVVKDAANGETLPGVSVVIKGTTKGTQTDFDGVYNLPNVTKGAILVFNYLGMKAKEVVVNSNEINVSLEEAAEALAEIVVIGYGTQKITNVSGAISTIKTESIEKLKPLRVEEALQGSASGVSVIQSGSPGSKPTVLVRGIPSFSGTDPVVIIDGVPQSLDDLNSISSADIESLNILKDAASTAIYGVKGGNGVIVVTTKGGRKGQKAEFNFNSYTGVQSVIRKIQRVSKPGLRLYSSSSDLPRVLNGLGIAIVSTSKGVMTVKQARRENVGGEVLCSVY